MEIAVIGAGYVGRGGVIIGDDYCPPWPGVVKYLQEEAHRRNICQIEGTEMAIYIDQEGR